MALLIPNVRQPVTNNDRTMTRQWFTPIAALFRVLRYIDMGPGDPTGVVTMPQGSVFLRTDGGAGTTLYILEGPTSASWDAKA